MSQYNGEWYFSRSHAELGDKCPRARYNHTFLGGRGVEAVGSSFELSFGSIIHRSTEMVLKGTMTIGASADYAASSAYKLVANGIIPCKVPAEFHEQFHKEAQSLAAGMVWAWGLHVLPSILGTYNVVQVETQTAYRRDGFVLPTVADVVLETKTDRSLIYPDWKTAAWVNASWMAQWNRSAQLHQTARAIEQVLGREVEYCYVQALVKGEYNVSKGYQNSPLVWAYQHPDRWEGDINDKDAWSWVYTARKGFKRIPQWLSGMTPEQWVRAMPPDLVANKVVPRTPPIVVDPDLAETWWRQHVIKERRYRASGAGLGPLNQLVMDEVFPQSFQQCQPVIGFDCDYMAICHDPTVGDDPIGSGLYRRRPTYQERLAEENAN